MIELLSGVSPPQDELHLDAFGMVAEVVNLTSRSGHCNRLIAGW